MSAQETYKFAGYELSSPLINAAGSVNGSNEESLIREGRILGATGLGAITYGSFTIPRQLGNEAQYGLPVLIIDTEQGKTWNSMGLPNIGLARALELAPSLVEQADWNEKVIIYSGSPTNSPEHGTSVEQAVKLAYEMLGTQVDLVELNVSCPNVVTEAGGRKPIMGYDLQTMYELVESLKHEVGRGDRLGIKLPPYLSEEEVAIVPDLAKLIRASKVFRYIATTNTIPGQIPTDKQGNQMPLSVPGGAGGMSGPATQGIAREQLALWHDQTDGEIDINSAGGVDSGYELHIRRKIGAKVGSGVTFLWRSRNWGEAVTGILSEFVDEESSLEAP